MFVARRPFRDTKGMVPAGSIVEPASIKRFKHRFLEGHIVEVNEQNFDEYAYFFKNRFGIDLPKPTSDTDIKEAAKVEVKEAVKPAQQETIKTNAETKEAKKVVPVVKVK